MKQIYINTGKYKFPVQIQESHNRIFFKFGYNQKITDEIKCFSGTQYHGYADAPNRDLAISIFNTDKVWSCVNNQRNQFQLDFLSGVDVYHRWDNYLKNPPEFEFTRPLLTHQKELTSHGLSVHYGIWAAEMGTGKTLSAIELMERSGATDWWYVAPKSALRAVSLEFQKWGLKVHPKLMTYNELVTRMKAWKDGDAAPQGVIFDESQRIKTPTSQRSEAAMALANGIRDDWGDDGFVILMSGSPAPKSPLDWWHQCEVAYPGFIREGTPNKFKFRLSLHEKKESFAGGSFMERVTWWDDEEKCGICGMYEEDIAHSPANAEGTHHSWQASVNEVAKLYRRMKGLVIVKFKRDCTDLPEKQYRIINCPVLPSTVRAAKLLAAKATSAVSALTLLRELSDGFQYVEVQDGEKDCDTCGEDGKVADFELKPEYVPVFEETGLPPQQDENESEEEYHERYYNAIRSICPQCAGSRKVSRYIRDIQRVPCPKDDVLRELLDEHSDIGRLVVYAGFEGSVNRCVEVALDEKWAVVKWDGKGLKIYSSEGDPLRPRTIKQGEKHRGNSMDAEGAVEPLIMFQEDFANFPKVCFIGNPGAAGTGLTLTASPSIFYYSNSFNADERIQSEDRIHRVGMDENRGATIIDVLHLPSDKYVLDNLTKKRKLQDISMGELNSIFSEKSTSGRLF